MHRLAKHNAGSTKCRPWRPAAARRIVTHARLFKIRSLHSDSGTVVLDAEGASPPLSNAVETATEPVHPQLLQPAAPQAQPARAAAGSRSALMAAAGRKLIFATPKAITYLDGRWATELAGQGHTEASVAANLGCIRLPKPCSSNNKS